MELKDAIRAGVAGVVALLLLLTGLLNSTTDYAVAMIGAVLMPRFPIGGSVVANLVGLVVTVGIYVVAIWIVAAIGGFHEPVARFVNQTGRLIRDGWRGVWPAFATAMAWLWHGITIPLVWIVQGVWSGVVAFSTRFFPWLWSHALDSPQKAFWLAIAALVFCQLLDLVGYGVHTVIDAGRAWFGFVTTAHRGPAPYPSFLVGAIALFALMVATDVYGRRPKKLAFVALAGAYLSVCWPLYGAMIAAHVPQPLQRWANARHRQVAAIANGLANRAEADAFQAERQANAERDGRLARVTANTACLLEDGTELLSTTGHRNLLQRGREGRWFEGDTPAGVRAALDGQDAMLVSFQYEEEDPTWSRGVLRCWVDDGHLYRGGVRPAFASSPDSSVSSWWPFGGKTANAAVPPSVTGGAPGSATTGTSRQPGELWRGTLAKTGEVACNNINGGNYRVLAGAAKHGDRQGRPYKPGVVVAENCYTAMADNTVVVVTN